MIDLAKYREMPIQGTVEWYKARLGKFNASRISELMGKGKEKDEYWSKTALSYINEVASERNLNPAVVGDEDMFWLYLDMTASENKWMRWGSEHEHEARNMYEFKFGFVVTLVGSVAHPHIPNFCCSPDGLVESTNSGIEIKCPMPKTYWEYRTQIHDNATLKAVKPEYYWQVMANIAVCDLDYVDFVCWCGFMEKPLHVVRIERDESELALLVERVGKADLLADGIELGELNLAKIE